MYPNLDAEMARKKITRAALANLIHMTASTLSMKLNGKATLTLLECIKIRDAVDESLEIDYLFASEEDITVAK